MVELLDGEDYQIIDKIELPRGAGRAVFNPVDHNYSVESGSHEPGAQTHKLNIIDTQNFKLLGDSALPDKHSEAMAVVRAGKKVYVNLARHQEVGFCGAD